MKLSLCMIVKNESETLSRCLESVKSAMDEIIIVDTGSSDDTKKIALEFTDKVYDFMWIDDFSAARNYSFSKATGDYIIWLDADDVIDKKNIDAIIELKNNIPTDVNAIYMRYDVAFDENDKPTFSYFRERMVKRAAKPIWIEPIHEIISVNGKNIYSEITVQHRKIKANPPKRNLNIFEKTIAKGKKLSPRLSFYYARELMFNKMPEKAITVFEEFLETNNGWFENKITACRDLSYCYEQVGNNEKAFLSALHGLRYDFPRSELLCRIGELFLKENRLNEAEFWYLQAINQAVPKESLGFIEEDYYGYVPALQLCVIYYNKGNLKKAVKYNEIAGKYKPSSTVYLFNKKFFEKRRGESL